jgi:hypothetical protein
MLTLLPKGVQKNNENFFPHATGVHDTSGAPCAVNISANFQKIRNGPNGTLRGLGKLIHEKNLKSITLMGLSL